MRFRDFFLLALLQAVVLFGVAHFQRGPGYMDAEYYTVLGRRLATGHGATEPFLWHYLDDPQGVPHPAFGYWAPLSAWLAGAGLWLWTSGGYAAARGLFLLLGLLLPPLTAWLAWRLTRRRAVACLAGSLAVASGYYLPYWPVPETFTPTAVLGGLFWVTLLAWEEHPRLRWAAALGLISAALHLTRNEGGLWFGVAGVALALSGKRTGRRRHLMALLGGYLVGYSPRLAYNLTTWGALSPPGTLRVLWLTSYNELFSYPAETLTMSHWLAQGVKGWLRAWAWAMGRNLLTAWAVQGQIVLFPFIGLGFWYVRRRLMVRVGFWGGLALLVFMTLIFPFPGARGGFFHAGTAIQPLLWALGALGVIEGLHWAARRRGWPWPQAGKVLGGGLLAVLALFSFLVVAQRVVGPDFTHPVWNASERDYARLATWLARRNGGVLPPVLVNNPPAWAWVNQDAPAYVIPDGGPATAEAVAQRYGVSWMILEANHPQGLADLYGHPRDIGGWRYVATVNGAHFFLLEGLP